MSVKLEDFKPGSVAVHEQGSLCVITEVHPENPVWPMAFITRVHGMVYKGCVGDFKAVVGSVDLDALKGILMGL